LYRAWGRTFGRSTIKLLIVSDDLTIRCACAETCQGFSGTARDGSGGLKKLSVSARRVIATARDEAARRGRAPCA
jgi:hypothetical protein